ncbi:MAG TPA: hypothetical protein VLX61_04055 [Anaerolineales bacterium]|nr:hypothetical protein [Anaerolineales bacterium]
MKYTLTGLWFGLLMLIISTGCEIPAGGVPLGLAPTPTPTYAPPVVQAPLGAKPPCSPPVPSIGNINSFCANPAAGLGGATWTQNPPDEDPSVAQAAAFIDNYSKNPDCSNNQSKVVCSGPQDAKITYQFCTSCGSPGFVDAQKYDVTFGPNVCKNGYVKDANTAYCVPADKNQTPDYAMCPAGTHYDNPQQNCVDDVTDQLSSPCPPGYPYYMPMLSLCLAKAYPIVYDCQTFTVQLGDCSLSPNNPNLGSKGNKSCPAGTSWNGTCCANADHRCP